MELETFAPPVDIQAEMGQEPPAPVETPADTVQGAESAPDTVQGAQAEDTLQGAVKEEKPEDLQERAIQAARRREKEAREKAERIEKESQARFEELTKRIEALTNQPKALPSFEENPAEHLRLKAEQTEAELRQMQQERQRIAQEQEQATKQQEAMRYVATEVSKAEATFKEKNPDYQDAIEHMRKVADNNLIVAGYDDPAERAQIIQQQSLALAIASIQKGKSPAEVAYAYAKNYGWAPKADAAKQIAAINKANSFTQSLGSGGKSDQPLSLKALEKMDKESLDAAISDAVKDDEKWSKLFGPT